MVVTEEIQTAYDTAQKKVTTNYTYDSKLNKTSETTGDYAVQYTYDNKYSLPLTTTYKRDADTTVVVTNTLTADEKNIASSVTTENGAVKAKTQYTYDGFGNITAQKIWEKDDKADSVLDRCV